jgi:hypothetical protein
LPRTPHFFASSLLFFPNSPYLCSPNMLSHESIGRRPIISRAPGMGYFRSNTDPVHKIIFYVSSSENSRSAI